jgi:hypothetical protein
MELISLMGPPWPSSSAPSSSAAVWSARLTLAAMISVVGEEPASLADGIAVHLLLGVGCACPGLLVVWTASES